MSCISYHMLSSAAGTRYPIPILVSCLKGVYIIRTLDPEQSHLISLARIFRAAGLSIVQGILKFKLHLGLDYTVHLGVAGPNIIDIWVEIGRARTIIALIWRTPPTQLIKLTSPTLDKCWSLFDPTRSSILHNWCLSTISPAEYSTRRLQETVFQIDDVHLIKDKSRWLRTGLPDMTIQSDDQSAIEVSMIQWASDAAQRVLYLQESELIIDHWTPVVEALYRRLGMTPESPGLFDDRAPNQYLEAQLAACVEHILLRSRNLFGTISDGHHDAVQVREPPILMIDKSTQTEILMPLDPDYNSRSTQTQTNRSIFSGHDGGYLLIPCIALLTIPVWLLCCSWFSAITVM